MKSIETPLLAASESGLGVWRKTNTKVRFTVKCSLLFCQVSFDINFFLCGGFLNGRHWSSGKNVSFNIPVISFNNLGFGGTPTVWIYGESSRSWGIECKLEFYVFSAPISLLNYSLEQNFKKKLIDNLCTKYNNTKYIFKCQSKPAYKNIHSDFLLISKVHNCSKSAHIGKKLNHN